MLKVSYNEFITYCELRFESLVGCCDDCKFGKFCKSRIDTRLPGFLISELEYNRHILIYEIGVKDEED